MRFVMIGIIVLCHSQYLLGQVRGAFPFCVGSLAVEFFFLVSGYLLMKSISKIKERGEAANVSAWQFLGHKVQAFLPEVVIAYFMTLILSVAFCPCSLAELVYKIPGGFVGDLLMLKCTGLVPWIGYNGVVWYLSSMLLCMAVLFPLLRRWGCQPWVLLVCLLPLGALLHNAGTVLTPYKWVGDLTYRANVRAFCEIGLGAFAFPVTEALCRIPWSTCFRRVLTVLKWALLAYIIAYMYFPNFPHMDGFFLLVMWAYIVLVFSRISADSGWYNKNLFILAGRVSLPLYLGHQYLAFICLHQLPTEWPSSLRLGIYLLCAAISTAVIMALAALWRQHAADMKRLFVTPPAGEEPRS